MVLTIMNRIKRFPLSIVTARLICFSRSGSRRPRRRHRHHNLQIQPGCPLDKNTISSIHSDEREVVGV